MTWEIIFVLVLLVCTFAAMVWEKISVDVVALLAMCALMLSGILTPQEAFQVFSNDAAVTVACMFILSAALEHTGAIELIGRKLNKLPIRSDWSLLLIVLPMVALLSAFVNNTPIVVVFMPLLISLAAKRDLKPSKILIPLSYAAIFGGCCTLIGTSTNLLVSSTAAKLGQKPISMFELAAIGVPMAVVGMVYLLTIGRKLLPERETLATLLESTTSKEYLTEAVILAGSPLIGKTIADTPLKSLPDSRIIDIERGGVPISMPLKEVILQQGDRLRLTTILKSVMEIKELEGISILPKSDLGLEQLGTQKAAVVETIIGPDSELIGKTIAQVNFRQRFGVLILAVHRQGVNLRENFDNVRLHFGDTLLLEGTQAAIHHLSDGRNFLMLADAGEAPVRRSRLGVAVATIAGVVLLAATGMFPISLLALVGALVVILTGCLEVEQAYKSIQWRIVFLIFGMLSLGLALDKTGGAKLLADSLLGGVKWLPPDIRPMVALSVVYLLTMILTEFLSNNAVAVLVTPIVINAALSMGVSTRPFIIAVAMAASASFSTPIGYQTNTLVYGAGGYQFRDFMKVGIPLNLLFWLMATLLIPLIWPL